MMMRSVAVTSIALAGILLTGCKPDAALKRGEAIDGGTKPTTAALPAGSPVDPASAGTVTGEVSFSGKQPERLPIDMSQDPVCAMTGGQNEAEQYVIKNGKLANVYVYVKSGPAAAMNAAPSAPLTPVVLDQKGCKYVPHVVAVMRGGAVEFRNSDATMHNIHTMPTVVGNEVIDVSQGPKGAPQVRRFTNAEAMMPVRCNNHPWMNAFINISATPFFAVSAGDGSFTIPGLPAGEYTLGFVHEKMGEKTAQVTVTAQGTVKAAVAFSMAKP